MSSLAVLSGAGAVLRLAVASGLLVLAWRQLRRGGEARESGEDESPLSTLLVGLLVVLALIGWPLFYALLQSLVSETPGAMCIFGVTRIGLGSLGPSRWLPLATRAVQGLAPVVLFLAGCWFVLHRLDRRSPGETLARGKSIALIVFASFAGVQSVSEAAWVALPRQEDRPPLGCCFSLAESAASTGVRGPLEASRRLGLIAGFVGLHGLLFGLLARDVSWTSRGGAAGPVVRAALALLALGVAAAVLVEVLAPRLLRLPLHRCAYDLLARLPESAVGIFLYLLGAFATGWACLAAVVGQRVELDVPADSMVRGMSFLAFVAYVAALGLMGTELIVT